MADTKIGLDQINKPAPLWLRRLTNGMIIFIIPGLVGLIQGLSMNTNKRNMWMMILAFAPALFKGLCVIAGNGTYINDGNSK